MRGPSGPRGAADLALALAIGGCIAGYTLVDQEGVGHASTPAYLLLVFVFAGAGYVGRGVAGARRRRRCAAPSPSGRCSPARASSSPTGSRSRR